MAEMWFFYAIAAVVQFIALSPTNEQHFKSSMGLAKLMTGYKNQNNPLDEGSTPSQRQLQHLPQHTTTTSTTLTWCGFQSESKMMTVSADCRLRPRPPALVLRMKMKNSEPGALNFSSSRPRSSDLVVPSSRRYLKPRRGWKTITKNVLMPSG